MRKEFTLTETFELPPTFNNLGILAFFKIKKYTEYISKNN